ncbi:MAG: IS110 family transposase [Anaerolineales bacterium]
MAKRVEKITLGIDVAKDTGVVHVWETTQTRDVPNQSEAIVAYLKSLQGPVRIAIESTSNYHRRWVELALARGFEVYLINPRQLAHYREVVNQRNKTDPADAWLLARFLAHEAEQLRPCQPQDAHAQALWALLKRRAKVVEARKQLQLSFREIQLSAQALFTQFARLLARIDQRIQHAIQTLGWNDDYQRCLTIPGIGPLNAAALVATYHRGVFASSDAFVAFIGIDVRMRESGGYKGKRKLTKRGEAEIRRLLYCATQPAASYPPFKAYYQQQIDKGLSKIAAKVILARKLARIAFALMRNQTLFIKTQEKTLAYVP